jgi:hypothetical protein
VHDVKAVVTQGLVDAKVLRIGAKVDPVAVRAPQDATADPVAARVVWFPVREARVVRAV